MIPTPPNEVGNAVLSLSRFPNLSAVSELVAAVVVPLELAEVIGHRDDMRDRFKRLAP